MICNQVLVLWSAVLDTKAKAASAPFLKCPTQFPIILWHPYARHHYFCVMTEKEQKKWHAVFQDCVRHSNNGESPSQTKTEQSICSHLIIRAECMCFAELKNTCLICFIYIPIVGSNRSQINAYLLTCVHRKCALSWESCSLIFLRSKMKKYFIYFIFFTMRDLTCEISLSSTVIQT